MPKATPIEIHTIPVLSDNYIHVLHDYEFGRTIVVDPAVADPVTKFLGTKSWNLTHIFLTHHHHDHVGGVNDLKKLFPATEVCGYEQDQHRLPRLTKALKEGSRVTLGNFDFEIWHLPGHTTGHIAYISNDQLLAFTGDVLFGLGCGRVFEGTYEDMFSALSRLKTLNPKTQIFCTHEYTLNNGAFAKSQFPDSQNISDHVSEMIARRESGAFTVPLLLEQELRANPFLLAKNVEEFSRLRDARNKW